MIRKGVVPAALPLFVTWSWTRRPLPSFVMPATEAVNGPMPATANRASNARATIPRATATKTVPWTCELAESRSPSGLQRSQRPTSRATGAPQRAHGWVRTGATDVLPGGAVGVTVGSVIGRSIVPRTRAAVAGTVERGGAPSAGAGDRALLIAAYQRSAA